MICKEIFQVELNTVFQNHLTELSFVVEYYSEIRAVLA